MVQIILAVAVPVAGLLLAAYATWAHYRDRKEKHSRDPKFKVDSCSLSWHPRQYGDMRCLASVKNLSSVIHEICHVEARLLIPNSILRDQSFGYAGLPGPLRPNATSDQRIVVMLEKNSRRRLSRQRKIGIEITIIDELGRRHPWKFWMSPTKKFDFRRPP